MNKPTLGLGSSTKLCGLHPQERDIIYILTISKEILGLIQHVANPTGTAFPNEVLKISSERLFSDVFFP
jgi:hypothetical protein